MKTKDPEKMRKAAERLDQIAKEAAKNREKIPGGREFNSTVALRQMRYGADHTRRKRNP